MLFWLQRWQNGLQLLFCGTFTVGEKWKKEHLFKAETTCHEPRLSLLFTLRAFISNFLKYKRINEHKWTKNVAVEPLQLNPHHQICKIGRHFFRIWSKMKTFSQGVLWLQPFLSSFSKSYIYKKWKLLQLMT